MTGSDEVVEHVEAVQSLDVHVLVAQLIGAVQSLSKQNQQQAVLNQQQAVQLQEQAVQIKELQIQAKGSGRV